MEYSYVWTFEKNIFCNDDIDVELKAIALVMCLKTDIIKEYLWEKYKNTEFGLLAMSKILGETNGK